MGHAAANVHRPSRHAYVNRAGTAGLSDALDKVEYATKELKEIEKR
jgi:hypothetical protein